LTSSRSRVRRLAVAFTLLFAFLDLARVARAQQVNPSLGISQVYGAGGNSGAVYRNDFIEIYNRSNAPVSLSGLSVQYTSATGTGLFSQNFHALPAFTLNPGQYYLIAESGGTNGIPLPTADASGTLNMAAGAGKVVLVASAAGLACNGSSTPCTPAQLATIVDLVGYGTGASGANFFEGSSGAPTISATLSDQRAANGQTDTNQNGADFTAAAPNPRNSAGGTGGDTGTIGNCGDAATAIHAIQGAGVSSGMAGAFVSVEAVVVGDFQEDTTAVPPGLDGFYLQQANGTEDGDPATSEGIFVFQGASTVDVAVGSVVRVRGQVAEFDGLTEVSNVSHVVVCGASAVASPASLTFPVAAVGDLERYEGMLVDIPQTLTVTGNFDLGRFGSLDLSVGGRLYQPSNVVAPGAAATALQSQNDRSRIILDDHRNDQDPNPIPYKDANDTRRVGDTLPSLTGILDDRFAAYRIQPTTSLVFTNANPRVATPPPVGGRLRVASMNLLNYFTTLDTGAAVCGPSHDIDCRGANTSTEFDRQFRKLLNVIEAINPDIGSLMEVENGSTVTVPTLVNGLNAELGAGTYSFVDTGDIGTDAIKVAFIYKPAKVTTPTAFKLLTSAYNPLFIDTKNRPSLGQTFREVSSGALLTVVANHLKSKGSDCNDVSDPDTGDGQGNCNLTRNEAAQVLLQWIADPAQHFGPDVLLVGDLNSYAKEDPVVTLKNGGFASLIDRFIGTNAYSYQFDGQSGYLDHALATATLVPKVTGTAEWHNNADEPTILDYNLEFKTDDPYNGSDPFRESDHDPIVVGLNLGEAPAVPAASSPWLGALAFALAACGALILSARRGDRRRIMPVRD
jgi:hypothetical protein